MDSGRPLALKRQRAIVIPRAKRFDLQAEVVIDTDSFHLVEPFTYGVSDDLVGLVQIGSKVRVPFRNSIVDGYVLSFAYTAGLSVKPIIELHNCAPIPSDLLATAKEVAARYGTRLADILTFVPEASPSSHTDTVARKSKVQFRHTDSDLYEAALEEVRQEGRILLIAPTERELDYLQTRLTSESERPIIRFSSQGGQRARRTALATLARTPDAIAVGARSSIFLPTSFRKVVIVGELSSHYWEQRGPYWNLRDVALLRAQHSGFELTFLAPAPSLEMQRLIDIGFVRANSNRRPRSSRKFAFDPASYHETIRGGLKRGVVLVSVAEKAYSNFFNCDRCRTTPLCDCGGRIIMASEKVLTCSLCGRDQSEWSCGECGSNRRRLLKKGATRIGVELGKAFPNTPIWIASSAQTIPSDISTGIVVATPGAEPLGLPLGGLVLLDGEALIARSGLRGEELLRNFWMKLIGATKSDAPVYISLLANHPISQALISGNVGRALRNELRERVSLELPPIKRFVVIEGEERELLVLTKELHLDIPTLGISAPLRRSAANAYLNIRFDHDQARDLANRLFTLQRYRASTKRALFTIRFDPLVI